MPSSGCTCSFKAASCALFSTVVRSAMASGQAMVCTGTGEGTPPPPLDLVMQPLQTPEPVRVPVMIAPTGSARQCQCVDGSRSVPGRWPLYRRVHCMPHSRGGGVGRARERCCCALTWLGCATPTCTSSTACSYARLRRRRRGAQCSRLRFRTRLEVLSSALVRELAQSPSASSTCCILGSDVAAASNAPTRPATRSSVSLRSCFRQAGAACSASR